MELKSNNEISQHSLAENEQRRKIKILSSLERRSHSIREWERRICAQERGGLKWKWSSQDHWHGQK